MKVVLAAIFVVRVIVALVAVWQVVGLLPTLTWLAAPSQVTPGMWFIVALKVIILALCLLGFFGLKRVAAKLRGRTETQSAPA